MESPTDFFFVICQNQSNAYCKREIEQQFPDAHLAFSRPGFLTFKATQPLSVLRQLRSTFVRTMGLALQGKRDDDGTALCSHLVDNIPSLPFDHLHVFERELLPPGKNGFEPGRSVLAKEVAGQINQQLKIAGKQPLRVNQVARPDELVVDVVLVEPNHWWLGFHRCESIPQRWPGGVPPADDFEPISRAYFKMHEALAWSGIPLKSGETWVEIGSSPGGSCQRLLEEDVRVLAIDPADLNRQLSEHPNLTHLRCRAKEVRRKLLKPAKWLVCDANISPHEVISILQSWFQDGVSFTGMLLTLKLGSVDWFDQVDTYRDQIAELGFKYVRTRQLAFNKNEICLLALKSKSKRRW